MTSPAPTTANSLTTQPNEPAPASPNPMKSADSTTVHSLPAEDYAEGIIEHAVPFTVLRDVLQPTLGPHLRADGIEVYRRRLLAQQARRGNQLDTMLLDQLSWCHFLSGQLIAEAARTEDPKHQEILSGSAIKLMAEVRKTALTLRDVQTPPAVKQVTVVKQQNVAAGDQQVALVEAGAAESALGKKNSNTQLVSNGAFQDHERLITADPATDCWPTEPAEAQAAVLCRS